MMPEHFITSALQVKYCVLLCGDDIDPHVRQILFDDQKFLFNIRSKVVKAASGALAMLTSASNKICNKVFLSYILGLTSFHSFGMYCTFTFSCMLLCLYRRCLSPSSGTTACSTCSPTPTTRSCCAARSSSSIWSPSAKMSPRRSLRLRYYSAVEQGCDLHQ